ncbi:MAG: DMT family transporter [Candidatus Dormibacterales bacterium]
MLWPALASALWGGMYVVSRLAFADVPPVTLGLARLLVGVAALLGVLRAAPPVRDQRMPFLGAVLAATLMLQFWGTDLAGAAAGSVLTLATPVFVALLAPSLLGEPTGARQWAGIGLALCGALLVASGSGAAGARSAGGDALLLASAAAWALFTVAGAAPVRRRGALPVTAAASVWAIPFLVPGAAVEAARGMSFHPSPGSLAAVLYLGLGATALAWWAWYRGVERLPAATAAAFFLIQPVVGVALSVPVFGLRPGPGLVGGGVLVAAGILITSRGRQGRGGAEPASARG